MDRCRDHFAEKSSAGAGKHSDLAQLNANKISSKKQPPSPPDRASCKCRCRRRRPKHRNEGGATNTSQLTAPKEESTFSRFEDEDCSSSGFLLGTDQLSATYMHNMYLPSPIKPFQSHYPDMALPSSPPNPGPICLAGELEMNLGPVQQSQEEVGGERAERGRHEIVLSNVTAIIESSSINIDIQHS